MKNEWVGPYQFQIGILPGSPKVGNLHLSILLKDTETGVVITDATVMVVAQGPDDATDVGPVQATNTPQKPQFYDVDIPLDIAGSWNITLEADSSLGKASLSTLLEVTEPGGFNLLVLSPGAVAILVLALWFNGKIRSRGMVRRF